jgi:hypothetical protein
LFFVWNSIFCLLFRYFLFSYCVYDDGKVFYFLRKHKKNKVEFQIIKGRTKIQTQFIFMANKNNFQGINEPKIFIIIIDDLEYKSQEWGKIKQKKLENFPKQKNIHSSYYAALLIEEFFLNFFLIFNRISRSRFIALSTLNSYFISQHKLSSWWRSKNSKNICLAIVHSLKAELYNFNLSLPLLVQKTSFLHLSLRKRFSYSLA